jgi:hypothetical protein
MHPFARVGLVSTVPSVSQTNPDDVAFLIRIVQPSGFANLWIVAGGVLTVDGD